jgi:hypothetical protein
MVFLVFFFAVVVVVVVHVHLASFAIVVPQLVPTQYPTVDKEHLLEVVVRGQRSAYVRQEHDEHDEGQLDDGRRVVDEQAFLQVLDEGRFENEMEMRRLEADKGTEQVEGLYAMLLLHKEVVECEEEDLEQSAKAMCMCMVEEQPLASCAQRRLGRPRAHGR